MIQTAFLLACSIVCAGLVGNYRPKWLLAGIGYFTILAVVIDIPRFLQWHLGNWNWLGKIISILVSLLAWRALRLSCAETAWVFPATRGAWVWTLWGTLVGVALGVTISYVFRDHQWPDAETLLFQATMPGLDEELAFRGIGFVLFARSFQGAARAWAPLTITSLLFGFIHLVVFNHRALHVEYAPLVFVLLFGFLLALIRLRSGSLLGPILGHNLSNTLGQLAAALP